MKNLNSLLVRLGALSLAAAMTFSAAEAATGRKDPKAAKAVIEALVQKTLANDASKAIVTPGAASGTGAAFVASGTSGRFTAIDTPLVIGKDDGKSENLELLVFGKVRAGGDVIAGPLGEPKKNLEGKMMKDPITNNTIFKTPGLKHIIGVAALNPHNEEFRISFRDKTATSHGAFVSLDFVTTAAILPKENPDLGKSVVGVQVHNLFCHPDLTVSEMATDVADGLFTDDGINDENMIVAAGGAVDFIKNPPDATDLRLQCVIAKNATTKNTSLRFAPQHTDFLADGNGAPTAKELEDDDTLIEGAAEVPDSAFFGANWLQRPIRVVYDTGTLSYQVASANIINASVELVNDQDIVPAAIFDLFSDDDLAILLEMLNEYFAGNTTKVREYLMAHRHQLSRAFKAIN